MTDHPSAAFPNLQDLLQHVQGSGEDQADGDPSAHETIGSLRGMVQRLAAVGAPRPVVGAEKDGHESAVEEPAASSDHEAEHSGALEVNFLQSFDSDELAHEVSPLVMPLEADAVAGAAPEPSMDLSGRGFSLTLGGFILLGLALYIACAAAPAWVSALKENGAGASWMHRLARAQTWLAALSVLVLTRLGVGSWTRRRWAVPLTHAGSWLTAISVLMGLAVASAGFFFVAPHSGNLDKAWLMEIARMLVKLGLLGVVVPLVLIAIYQRRHLPDVCGLADSRTRWTDAVSEPLLMLWLSVLAVAAAILCLLFFNNGFPFFGKMLSGTEGLIAIAGSVGACLGAAWMLARRQKSGWWLSWLLFAFLGATAVWTFLEVPWQDICTIMGRPQGLPDMVVPPKLPALLVGAVLAPLSMVLLMSRSAFPIPAEPDSPSLSIA